MQNVCFNIAAKNRSRTKKAQHKKYIKNTHRYALLTAVIRDLEVQRCSILTIKKYVLSKQNDAEEGHSTNTQFANDFSPSLPPISRVPCFKKVFLFIYYLEKNNHHFLFHFYLSY